MYSACKSTLVQKSIRCKLFLRHDIEYLCQKCKEQMKNIAKKKILTDHSVRKSLHLQVDNLNFATIAIAKSLSRSELNIRFLPTTWIFQVKNH